MRGYTCNSNGNPFWQKLAEASHHALWPFRAAAEHFGYLPSDIQIWCFLCAVFLAGLVVPHTYGDLVLARRRLMRWAGW